VFYSAPKSIAEVNWYSILPCARFSSIVSYFFRNTTRCLFFFFFRSSSSNHLMIRDQCTIRTFSNMRWFRWIFPQIRYFANYLSSFPSTIKTVNKNWLNKKENTNNQIYKFRFTGNTCPCFCLKPTTARTYMIVGKSWPARIGVKRCHLVISFF
jgi:hypothetical protein